MVKFRTSGGSMVTSNAPLRGFSQSSSPLSYSRSYHFSSNTMRVMGVVVSRLCFVGSAERTVINGNM